MNKPTTLLVASGLVLLASSSLLGQNLNERINHVMQQKAKAEATNSTKAAMLGSLLYSDLSVEFADTSAKDAIEHIAKLINADIVARYNTDRAGAGIDPETKINLNVQNKPALSILEMILDQCSSDAEESCTWQLRNGFIEVGTKERLSADSSRETRYYPIRDLLFDVPRFNNAPKLNLDSALNQGGRGGGGGSGGGGGGGFGGGGGGGSGGGGSGGGGGVLSPSGEEAPRISEAEKVEQIIDLIVQTIETDSWVDNGGDAASIRYYSGTLIVRAPDFIQRQIGGYPFAIRPVGNQQVATAGADMRYVTFSGALSNVEIIDQRRISPIGGGAAGN